MEDSVKKLLFLFITAVFMLTGAVLFSQEAVKDEAAKTTEKAAEKKKNPTKAFEMGEIVVKDRAIANVEDASTTTEITDKDIRARGDKTLGDSLQMVPGIIVSSSGKGNTRFTLRGYDQDKLAILVDGIPATDYSGSFDISQIPVLNVSKIVVNRGVASALYGANGSIGSVNVITKKPEEMFTEVNAEYGQWNNYTLNVANGSPIGNAYYWITGSVMNSGGYEVSKKLDASERTKWFNKLVRPDLYPSAITVKAKDAYINDTGKWNHTEYTKYQVGGKIGYSFTEKIEAGISANYYQNEQKSNTFSHSVPGFKYSSGTPTWTNPNLTTDGKSAVFQDRVFSWPEKYEYTVSPYFKGEFGDFTVKGNVYYYRQYTDLLAYAAQDYSAYMFGPANSIWTEESYGANFYPSYKIADWNRLNFSVIYRTDEHTEEDKAVATGIVTKKKFLSADYYTVAVEDELNFSKKVEISVGVSYDAQNLAENKKDSSGTLVDMYKAEDDSLLWGTRDSFNPTISVVWNTIKDMLKFRAAASSKTKFPSLAAYSSILGTAAAADLKINPERSYNGNIGFEVSPLEELLNIRMDYFYSRFNDKIESVQDSATGANSYTNIDGVVSQGIELTLGSKMERVAKIVDISSTVSYTYLHSRQMSDVHNEKINKGDLLENTPEHMFTVDLKFNFISDTSLNIFGTHTRNQIMYVLKTLPAANAPYSTEYFEAIELHNPYMFNVKVSQKIFENYDVFVSCKNILDDYNADPFNPGAGRMFAFGVSAKF
jgi:outer membrane receptor protein involved in Fe transport